MKHLFVSYELAIKLKEKGFDEPCFMYENDSERSLYNYEYDIFLNDKQNLSSFIKIPLYQQVVDWFREKHNIHININPQADSTKDSGFKPNGKYCGTIDDVTIGKEMFNTDTIQLIPVGDNYYSALNNAIEEALKLI